MDHGFVIAAAASGSGKTTLSLGLMRALSRRGIDVQPFKCGPDYIDTQFHSLATGNISVNLDTFLSSEQHAKDLFHHYSTDKDVAIVEGVMGMFDGYQKMKGSSADMARILNLPVILLVNAASTAYSVAPLIYGFKNFMPGIKLAGVIFNRVASPSHFAFLKDACDDARVECFGYLKRDPNLTVPSRHLGLTLSAREDMGKFISYAADAVEENVDIDSLLSATKIIEPSSAAIIPDSTSNNEIYSAPPKPRLNFPTVAVAHDEAFNFIYRANIDRLRSDGCNVIEFSPIHDEKLPDADFVYLPGGYPELFAPELSANKSMIQSIREYVEAGGRMWAECGGMIYLCDNIDEIPFCGILPLTCTMEGAKLSLGYRRVEFNDNIFYGHEFHYSRIKDQDSIPSVARQYNAKGMEVKTPVYRYKNVFASYTHLYWGDPQRNSILDIT